MKIILTLLFFFNFFVLSSKEVSKETCNIIKELVKNQIITLEKKSEKINYSGIKFKFSEKDGSAEILTIHPELRKEIWEKEWDISIFDYIEEINNIKVSELNEENFADEVSKSEINIKIFDVEKVYKISSKDYYELPVYFSYSFRNIKNN